MYLKSLRLENIACFEELDLDFTDENGEPCKWVVLQGENGVGKSTILYSLVFSIAHQLSGLESIRWKDFSKPSASEVVLYAPVNRRYKFIWDRKPGSKDYVRNQDVFHSELMYNSVNSIFPNGDFISAYGPWRKQGKIASNPKEVVDEYLNVQYGYLSRERFRSFTSNIAPLPSLSAWLSDLEYKVLKTNEGNDGRPKRNLEIAISSIMKILPEQIKFVGIKANREVTFLLNGIEVSLDALSDGYQSTMAWVGDLVRRLCEAFPDMENPLEAFGVVIIDELDLHLHPRWQRIIVQKIREIFPNLQFIVTTHSPFIAQDMTEKDKIIVLTRDGDKVTAHEEKGFVQNWRAGQILTSWLFGLPTEYDEKIEERLVQQQELVDRKAQGLLTDEEREELRQVTEFLSTLPTEETGAEILSQDNLDREAVRKAAAVALKLLRKVEGK